MDFPLPHICLSISHKHRIDNHSDILYFVIFVIGDNFENVFEVYEGRETYS